MSEDRNDITQHNLMLTIDEMIRWATCACSISPHLLTKISHHANFFLHSFDRKLCFYRVTRMHSADYAVTSCPSVRPSHAGIVSKRLYISSIFSPSTILVFPQETGWQYSDRDPPNRSVECKGV